MSNYQRMICEIADIICQGIKNKKSYVLLGNNSTGKSDILRKVIQKKSNEAVYFIDSVNRTFDVNRVELVGKSYESIKPDSIPVVEERINDFNFNLRDTFKLAVCAEQLFGRYEDQVRKMCKSFLNIDFQIEREITEIGLPENKAIIDGNDIKLSSGYQALVRLFCEMLFFDEVLKIKEWDRGLAVIDEIDEYLSPKYSAGILNFLQEEFPQTDFLVTTHSLDLVKNIHNANLIILRDLQYEIWGDSQLEDSHHLVEDIFAKLFFDDRMLHESDNDEIDEELRRLLNLKIAELWNEKAQYNLEQVKKKGLKPHQKMICRQIEEWYAGTGGGIKN